MGLEREELYRSRHCIYVSTLLLLASIPYHACSMLAHKIAKFECITWHRCKGLRNC